MLKNKGIMAGQARLKVGIVGCGSIGSFLARAIDKDFKSQAVVAAVCDKDKKKASALTEKISSHPRALSIKKLISATHLIVEAACVSIVPGLVRKVMAARKDIIVISVGGLLKQRRELFNLAKKSKRHIYIPSGAICGLDGIKSAGLAGISKIKLTSCKPSLALAGAPYLKKRKIFLNKIKNKKLIFKGTAKEAIANFPQNINVCATLSLASANARTPRVEVFVDPKLSRNIHVVEAEGKFGKMVCRTENLPFPKNPRTSYLAALSALKTFESIFSQVRIGT